MIIYWKWFDEHGEMLPILSRIDCGKKEIESIFGQGKDVVECFSWDVVDDSGFRVQISINKKNGDLVFRYKTETTEDPIADMTSFLRSFFPTTLETMKESMK